MNHFKVIEMHNEAIKKLEAIKPHIGDSQVFEVLKNPKRAVEVNIPFKKKGIVIKAHRVQYNDALGPAKGGIRFHPQADINETKALAFWMTIKNALMDLPYGGGKGSVTINPGEFSEEELEELSREFVRQMKNDIGPHKDIPAPDVYTDPQIMAWMMDEYSKINSSSQSAVVTGKPEVVGGNSVREYATSQGAFYVLEEALDHYGFQQTGLSVAIHGFGNAGQHVAKILANNNHRVVAVSDSKGGAINKGGLDVDGLIEYKKKNGTVKGYDGSEISNEELLSVKSDVLALAGMEATVTKENSDKVKSGLVLELANGPVTEEAEQEMLSRGIILLPDILANAGGVTTSYFEWIQGLSGDRWSADVVLEKLSNKMSDAFHKAHDYEKEHDIDLRTAAYLYAVERIRQAEMVRGRINK